MAVEHTAFLYTVYNSIGGGTQRVWHELLENFVKIAEEWREEHAVLERLKPIFPWHEIFALGRFYEKEDTPSLIPTLENETGALFDPGLKALSQAGKGENSPSMAWKVKSLRGVCADLFKRTPQENPTELPLTAGAIGYFLMNMAEKRGRENTAQETAWICRMRCLCFMMCFSLRIQGRRSCLQ